MRPSLRARHVELERVDGDFRLRLFGPPKRNSFPPACLAGAISLSLLGGKRMGQLRAAKSEAEGGCGDHGGRRLARAGSHPGPLQWLACQGDGQPARHGGRRRRRSGGAIYIAREARTRSEAGAFASGLRGALENQSRKAGKAFVMIWKWCDEKRRLIG